MTDESANREDEIAELVREERLIEAAEILSARGDARRASELFERACAWTKAASEATKCLDFPRALILAAQAGDEGLATNALAEVAKDPRACDRTAATLAHRGAHAWAARLYEATGAKRDAAAAWERADEPARAAALLEADNDVVGASRVLEAALRRDPSRHALDVALGRLLLRYGKSEAAVRALQRVPPEARERRDALVDLARALDQIGLREASAAASAELEALGGASSKGAHAGEGASANVSPKQVKTRLFGRYEVVRDVAQSPSARVVECIDAVRGDRVAVKIFAAYDMRGSGRDAVARFEREVRVTAAIDHPNVVPLLDFIPEGPAIVLKWMSGGTLETMIGAHELSPARSVEIACALLTALGEAHRLGVLHRDVKPANVLFDDAGATRLADFGVAHLGDLSTTATAGVIGTLAYMSPEQREGHPATIQSDIYGVGAILYEMLTGERPSGLEPPRTRPSGAHRDLDARHDAIALQLIAHDPSARPSDAFAARRALTSLPWPSVVEPAAPRPASIGAPNIGDERDAARIETRADGTLFDRWTTRAFVRVALTESSLARASAFARSAHPALQTVLRVHREAAEIWLDAPRGHAPSSGLSRAQAHLLLEAAAALHSAGIVHGHIDPAHLRVDDENITLLFAADADKTTTIDVDRLAIARLTRNSI